MPAYTKPKVLAAIKSIEKALEVQLLARAKTQELKIQLKRIAWAIEPSFKEFLKDLERKEIITQTAKLDKEDPNGDKWYNPKGVIRTRARTAIIKASPYSGSPVGQGWPNFVHHATQTQLRDRAHFIKSGEIIA